MNTKATFPVTASAPGKMVLLGEYAVLEGCPALSLAVNNRASVTIEQSGTDRHTLKSSLFADNDLEFSVRNDDLLWSDDAVAAAVGLNTFLRPWLDVLGDIHAPALSIRLDTSDFYLDEESRGLKLGLGSSAALGVACAGAFGSLRGENPSLPALVAAHQDSQDGSGSGVDVATALNGGLIRFQRMDASSDPSVQKLNLPPAFAYSAVWSGESASTGLMLRQFNQWTRRHVDQWQMCLLAARVICDAACRAIEDTDATALVRTIKGYGNWMKALEKASGLSIYTPAHSFLDTMATRCGCSYKPSGAGGGDIGVVAANNIGRLAEFQRCAKVEGYTIIDLKTDQNGLQVSG